MGQLSTIFILAFSVLILSLAQAMAEHGLHPKRDVRLASRRWVLSSGDASPAVPRQPASPRRPRSPPRAPKRVLNSPPSALPALSPPTPAVPPSLPPPSMPPVKRPPPPTPSPQPPPSRVGIVNFSPPVPPSPPPRSAPRTDAVADGEEDVSLLFEGGNCPDSEAVLSQHNQYRARHQAPPLRWDKDLAAGSATYAQKLAKEGCAMKHSTGRDYGENLLMVQRLPRPDSDCVTAVNSWYGEVYYYDFRAAQPFNDNYPKGVGHFTQLVWKSSSLVGCGLGLSDMPFTIAPGRTLMGGCKIIVCRYQEPGNVANDMYFLKNVLPNITTAFI